MKKVLNVLFAAAGISLYLALEALLYWDEELANYFGGSVSLVYSWVHRVAVMIGGVVFAALLMNAIVMNVARWKTRRVVSTCKPDTRQA